MEGVSAAAEGLLYRNGDVSKERSLTLGLGDAWE
jgi:hypothetical protein